MLTLGVKKSCLAGDPCLVVFEFLPNFYRFPSPYRIILTWRIQRLQSTAKFGSAFKLQELCVYAGATDIGETWGIYVVQAVQTIRSGQHLA